MQYEAKLASAYYVYLSVILINFVVRMGENYYPQVFLEECKYIVKENNLSKFINDELESDSSGGSDYSDDSDKENV